MKKVYNVTPGEINDFLAEFDHEDTTVYGVPNGGLMLAAYLTEAEVVFTVEDADIILDDLIDSGVTMERYKAEWPDKQFKAMFDKRDGQADANFQGQWIVFPWERSHPNGEKTIEDNIVRILQYIGEKPERDGLVGTPDRVVRMYSEIFRGYDPAHRPKVTIFKNGADGLDYNQMITDEGSFHSHCEHHMVPFFGKYYFAYIPSRKGNILGLSKVARIVDYHAAKLQIQERLGHDIVEDLWKALCTGADEPLGMALMMRAEHLCKTMRGVKKKGQATTTTLKGVFLTEPKVKQEFLNSCKI